MTPLYKKIIDDLLLEIKHGKLEVNEQLPTEKELAEIYHVSRITSKRALTELENMGIIYRVQGKGSYVKTREIHTKNTKKTARILFLIPFAKDLSLGNFSEGLLPVAKAHHYEVILSTPDFLLNKEAKEIMAEFNGMIYYAQNTKDFLMTLFELSIYHFPIIILDKKIYELPYPTIQSDNLSGGLLATNSLIQQGHQRIAYLFGEENTLPQSVKQRYLGYIQAIKTQQLPFYTHLEEKTSCLNQQTIDYFLGQNITGVICENDLVAIALIQQAKQIGVKIPEQLAVIGFDNIQASALIDPPLTTIAQNFQKMGHLAGEQLIHWIENHRNCQDQQIPIKLIIRESTKEKKDENN